MSSPSAHCTILLLSVLAAGPVSAQGRPALSDLERGIVEEHNAVRQDPAAYAKLLEELLPRYQGTLLERPGDIPLRTIEGAAPVREAIGVLRRTKPVGPLRASPGLAAAARDHVRDQGPSGGLEHRGRDGSRPAERAGRYGVWEGSFAENISFGPLTAREVVVQLLVDDGVPGRGHRRNMLDPELRVVGVACGPHAAYQQMCVMDFAAEYREGR